MGFSSILIIVFLRWVGIKVCSFLERDLFVGLAVKEKFGFKPKTQTLLLDERCLSNCPA